MPKFIIQEMVTYEVEAETAQAALDLFLNSTDTDFPLSVDERHVFDENDIEQDVIG